MKKKYFLGVLVFCSVAASFAVRKDEVTLVMVPREDGILRVGKDVFSRYPTLLMSYKVGANGAVSLHGWTGKEWVSVSLDNFHAGTFFRAGPDSALIIEREGTMLPESLTPPEEWCPSVYKIKTTDMRPLLHLVGQYYDFKFKEWEWFSKNYNLSVEAINPEGLNVAWYHKRFAENLKKQQAVGAEDLQYWIALRQPQPIEPEEVVVETEAPVEPETHPEMETPEDPTINPLIETAPAAVVMGATDANEAQIEESADCAEEK